MRVAQPCQSTLIALCLVIAAVGVCYVDGQVAIFTAMPDNPTRGIVGGNVTLIWDFSYTKVVTFRKWSLMMVNNIVIRNIMTKVGGNEADPKGDFIGRINFVHPASIYIEQLKLTDEGYIGCIVEFEDGVSLFNKIFLEIGIPAQITSPPPAANTVLEGDSITLQCEADGRNEPTMQWYLNGALLSNGGRVTITETNLGVLNNKTTIRSQLQLDNALPSDLGNITCLALNSFGQDSFATDHIVYFSARATSLTSDQSGNKGVLGQPLTISCTSQGNPVVYYEMYKDNVLIRNTTSGVYAIPSPTIDDEATYKCIPINYLGNGPQKEIALVIEVLPILKSSTTSPIATLLSTDVTIICVFYGKPDPVITWSKLGQSLPASASASSSITAQNSSFTTVSSSLIISNPVALDYGAYVCSADNAIGQTNQTIILDVQYEPVILSGSFSAGAFTLEHNTQGIFTLTCIVDANPRPTITWYKGNTLISNGGTPSVRDVDVFDGDNHVTINSTLSFSGWSKTTTGKYNCTASNARGSTRRTAQITVHYSPELSNGPAETTTYQEGTQISITCRFNSLPAANVTWTKDGVELTNPPYDIVSVVNQNVVEGAVTSGVIIISTFKVPSASRSDYGTYRCQASNTLGSNYTETTVIISFAPVLTDSSPSTSFVTEGHVVLALYCQWQGHPAPVIVWKKHAVTIPTDNVTTSTISSTIQETEVKSTLRLYSLAATESGNYTCEATNNVDTSRYQTALTVYYQPNLVTRLPVNNTINAGDSLFFTCTVEGNPRPVIEWLKDGATLNSSLPYVIDVQERETSPFQIRVTSNLTLASTSRFDAGVYTCRANNSVSVVDQVSTLIIAYAPIITPSFGPEDNYTETSSMFALECLVDSHPSSTITWFKDSSVVTANVNQVLVTNGMLRDKTNSRLEFPSGIKRNDYGQYKCTASNNLGSSENVGIVNVIYPPESLAPIVSAQNATKSGSVFFNCTVQANPMPAIVWLQNNAAMSSGFVTTTLSQARSSVVVESILTLSSLGKGDSATYTCQAQNNVNQLTQQVVLNVQYTPELLVTPANFTLNETTSVLLQCDVDANPSLVQYEWKKNGLVLPLSEGKDLELANAHENTIGTYECTPTNSLGRGPTVTYHVMVKVKPRIISNAKCTRLSRNDSSAYFNCTCAGDGTPKPSVYWTKLPSSDRLSNTTILIMENDIDVSGTYHCHFVSSSGLTTTSTTISFVGGQYGEWNAWSSCNNSCGAGMQNRQRVCNVLPCSDPLIEYQGCTGVTCPSKITDDEEESWLIALYVLIPLLLVLCILLILWLSRLNRNNDEKPVMVPVNNNISKPPSVRSVPTRQEIYLPGNQFGVLNAGYRPDAEQPTNASIEKEMESIEVEMNFDDEGPESETDNASPSFLLNGDVPQGQGNSQLTPEDYDENPFPPVDYEDEYADPSSEYDFRQLDDDLEQESAPQENHYASPPPPVPYQESAPQENHYASPPPPVPYQDESSTFTSF